MFYVYLYLMIGMVVTYSMDRAHDYRLPSKGLSRVLYTIFIISWLPLFLWGLVIAIKRNRKESTKS